MSHNNDLDAKATVNATASLPHQVTQLNQQLELMGQLLQRTCHLAFGLDPELDTQLQSLSSLIWTPEKISDNQFHLKALNNQLAGQQEKHEKWLSGWQDNLNGSLRHLNQMQHIPVDLRSRLKVLLGDLQLPRLSLYRLLPLTQDALNLLVRVAALPAPEHEPATSVSEQINQLVTLISRLHLSGADHELHQIRRRLLSPINQDELLVLCIEFINVLTSVLEQERNQAKQFLAQATGRLKELHLHNDKVLASHQQSGEWQQQFDNDMQGALNSLESGFADQDWQQANAARLALSQLWQERAEQEQQHRQTHQQQLEELRQQLTQLETEARQYREQLAQQRLDSLHDSLTQLPNRASFDEALLSEHKRLQRFGHPLWLAILDVDHFKEVNDQFGHSAGDKTLRVIASTIRRCLRDTDFIARFGGEEFVILFPELKAEDIQRPLQKIREAVRSIPFKFKEEDVRVTVSIGATEVHASEQPMVAFERADKALYQAKHNGRDQVVILSVE
ncbi:GGDEF domain-containing protein [Gallaecimonas mangrovi]|uniref:GGDEF domain-containing protein n=1 Tax=Gallaecimonas mangrovi TaxID=2291597 RepID=UPI000E1FFAED|nr:GGDEF domain-containing protein [Gallaecimonas mangrovi]